jgi:hypothetical protein
MLVVSNFLSVLRSSAMNKHLKAGEAPPLAGFPNSTFALMQWVVIVGKG